MNLTKEVVLKIAKAGIIIIGIGSSPYSFHKIAKHIFSNKESELAEKRARKLRELQKRKLLIIKYHKNGDAEVRLTLAGKKLVRRYNLDDMKLNKPKTWDKKWHIVIYDIPHKHQKASMAISSKLHQFGLHQLQKSVWISPYNCLPELEFICSIFDISFDKYFHYFKISTPPNLGELKKTFKL